MSLMYLSENSKMLTFKYIKYMYFIALINFNFEEVSSFLNGGNDYSFTYYFSVKLIYSVKNYRQVRLLLLILFI